VQLAATGGTTPYTWSVLPEAGSLPPGITLDAATGRLAGTPKASGAFRFTAQAADSAGRTSGKSFTIQIVDAVVIVTASPLPGGTVGSPYQQQLSATGGNPPYTWSLSAGALPAGIALDPATGTLSGTPSAAGAFDITVAVSDAIQSVTKPFRLSIGVPALPPVVITGLPDSGSPATQPTLGISLNDKYPLELTGQATLTFAPDSGVDDPAVQFTTGGRTVTFRIPAGATQAIFSGPSIGVQTGTVSGLITITTRLSAAGSDVTPTPVPAKVLRIAKAAPVIISAVGVRNGGGFDLVVVGYATPREVATAMIKLTPATGTSLETSEFTVLLTGVFPAWYQSAASAAYGSQFTLRIPFTVQNATNAVSSVTVSLTNAQGASTAATANF